MTFKPSYDKFLSTPGFGYEPRAVFASHPHQSRGRLIAEQTSKTRTPYQRDRDRILHANAFRRLKHKAQVFVVDIDDHHRSRLTHTMEVAQIARSIARVLRLDEDLTETIALAHDLGHPPFGHAGEDVLNQMMQNFGGFDHNIQSFRIVTKLEQSYLRFDGLNLTWETLEGLAKHNGPWTSDKQKQTNSVTRYNARQNLQLSTHASAEAQVATIADDIAYNAHDVQDGLRAGLFNVEQLKQLDLFIWLIEKIKHDNRDLNTQHLLPERLNYELVRALITLMVEDVLAQSFSRLDALAPQNVDEIRNHPNPVIAFSHDFAREEQKLKSFLFEHMYRHEKVMQPRREAEAVLHTLADILLKSPEKMPTSWQERAQNSSPIDQTRHICDYLAGMTDRYAIRLLSELQGK